MAYELNKIYPGDCLSLIKELPDKSIDCTFTSPPYNRIRNDTYALYNDNKSNSEYFMTLKNITDQSLRVTKGNVIINVQQNHFNKKEIFSYIGTFYNKIKGIVIWVKNNPQPGNNYHKNDNLRSITNAYEMFIVLADKDADNFKAYGKEEFKNVIVSNVNTDHFKGHGAVMNLDVAQTILGVLHKKEKQF